MMRQFRTDKLLALFIAQWLLFIVIGCSHVPVVPYGDPERLWRHVQQAYDLPQRPYQAEGTLRVDAPSFRHSVEFTLRWESALRLRLDLSGPFGISLASVALRDSQAWASIPLQGTYLSGTLNQVDSTAAGLLNVSLERVIKALAGLPPRETGPYQQALKGKDATEFFFQKGDTAKTFAADPKNGAIVRYTVAIANKAWAELGYGDFRGTAEALRPYRISIDSPSAEVKLDLLFDRIKDVASFPEDVWRQSLPEGTTPSKF
jgi:outer membrane biogenesis lipoprotein LolB